MAEAAEEKEKDLVKTFQILDRVAAVLTMILEGDDANAVSPAVAKLKIQFKRCEMILNNLPGGEMSRDEQMARIRTLTQSITRRRQIVDKYAKLDILQAIAEASELASENTGVGIQSDTPFDTNVQGSQERAVQHSSFSAQLDGQQTLSMTGSLAHSADHMFSFGAHDLSAAMGGQSGIGSTSGNMSVAQGSDDKDLDAMVL